MKKNQIITAVVLAAVAAAAVGMIVCGVRYFRMKAHAAEIDARRTAFQKLGLSTDGTSEFVPLPSILPHRPGAARLGAAVFNDAHFFRTPYRTCGACHALDRGGTDGVVRRGVLTRPVRNAVFAPVFLSDGSVTGLPALVQMMFEDSRFGAGGPLTNTVARLSADEALVRRFQACYEDGLTASNVVDAVIQHMRTLLTGGRPFDRYCGGDRSALSPEETAGFEIFKQRACVTCHNGPALGMMKVVDGKKVPGLRGIPLRKLYLRDGSRSDLGAVLSLMPGGAMEPPERLALISFLKTL